MANQEVNQTPNVFERLKRKVKALQWEKRVGDLFDETLRRDGYISIRSDDNLPINYHLRDITPENGSRVNTLLREALGQQRKVRIMFLNGQGEEIDTLTSTPPAQVHN